MTWTKTGNIRGPTGATGPQGPQGPTGSGILPADTTIAVGTRIISNKLVSTDANPVWQVMGDGKMNFGVGGATAMDTSFWRAGAGSLTTNGNLSANYGQAYQMAFYNNGGNAAIGFGSAIDTNLYRSNANQLKTDSGFYAVGPSGFHWNGSTWVIQTITSPGLGLYFGSDTNLYRRGAGVLQTDGGFYANTTSGYIGMLQPGDAALRWSVDFNGKLQWGPGNAAGDVSLYRNSAGVLNMNGSIYMGTGQAVGGAFAGMAASGDIYSRVDMTNNGLIRFGPGNAAQDVTVHRYNANQLGTYADLVLGTGGSGRGALYCNYTAGATNQVWVGQYGGTVPYPAITFGGDTYLYRYSAGILSTDGRLAVGSTAAFSIQTSGGIIIDLNNGQNAIYFGSAADATIYRSAASVLTVAGIIDSTGGITNRTLPVRIQNNVAANSWAGKDLNTADQNGWYYCSSSTTNTPLATDLYVMVMSHGGPGSGLTMQVAYYYYGNQAWYRTQAGAGTWTAWQQIWPLTDAAISAGRPALAAIGGQVPGNDFNGALNNGWYCAQPGTANSPKGISGYWAVE